MSSYRINGFEQIKAFFSAVFEQKFDFKPHHVSLYIFFINQNNRNNWVEWFKCPYDLAMAGACIGNKKTYYKCLNDLKEWGFIDYQKGVNEWKAPKVKLEVLKSTSTDTSTVPQSEPLLQPQHIPLPTPLPTNKYKLLTNNLKLITDNLDKVLNFLKPDDKFNFKKSFLDLGVDKQILDDWMQVRKNKKASNTKTAFTKFINQVNLSGLTVDQCIKICAEKDWKGFEAQWLENLNSRSNGNSKTQPATTIEDLIEINKKHFGNG